MNRYFSRAEGYHLLFIILCFLCGSGKEKAPAAKRLGNGCNEWRVTQRIAAIDQAFREPPASGARVEAQGAVRHELPGLAYVEVKGWRRFLPFSAKTMTARSALHKAAYLPEA